MATSRNKAVNIAVDQIREMADAVGQVDADVLNRATVSALNETADSVYELSRDRMTQSINLSDPYLRSRMRVDKATAGSLEASITASGAKSNMTSLFNYDAQMLIVPRKTNTPSRAKGALPIPTGMGSKQGGVRVTVAKGGPRVMPGAFVLPLKNNPGQYGVFLREEGKKSSTRTRRLMGPSVYQMFDTQVEDMLDEINDELQETLLNNIDAEVKKVLI